MASQGGHYRLIATVTRDHLRDHLEGYLAAAGAELGIPVPPPVRLDVASFVGGVVGLDPHNPKNFPSLALNANTRLHSPSDENFYSYRYDGQIAGVVLANDAATAESLATAYVSALEAFIGDHVYRPAPDNYNFSSLPFMFIEFGFIRSEFFGVTAVEPEGEKGKNVRRWYEPFRIEVAWLISEDGMGQHGT